MLHFSCLDWAASEPTGTTEDWGAEEWGNDKKDDTNTPSWATTDEKTSTWETADVPTSQNLTNHVNHLPEWWVIYVIIVTTIARWLQ